MDNQGMFSFHKQSCDTNWMGDYYCDCPSYFSIEELHDPLCTNKNYFSLKECNCFILTEARKEGYNKGWQEGIQHGYNEGYRDGWRQGETQP